MQIESIVLSGWKGLDRSIRLGRLNLLVGVNGVGKTAVALAPQFAVMGSTPLGERPEATMQLAGVGGCSVTVGLDDGFGWCRRVVRDHKKKTVSSQIQIAGQEGLSVKEADEEVKAHVGCFAPMFDLRRFLDLSDDKRRAFVLSLCARARDGEPVDGAEFTSRVLLEVLKDQLGDGLVAVAKQAQGSSQNDLVTYLMPQLSTPLCLAIEKAMFDIRDEVKGEITAALAATIDKAKELKNASKRDADRARQAIQRLSEQKAQITVAAETELALRYQYEQATKQRAEAQSQLDFQRGRATAKQSKEADIARLTEEIKAAEQRYAEIHAAEIPTEEEIAALEREADELAEKHAEPPEDPTPAMRDMLDGLRRRRDDAQARLYDARARLSEAQGNLKQLRRDLQAAEGDPWTVAVKLAGAVWDTLPEVATEDGDVSSTWEALFHHLTERAGDDPDQIGPVVQAAESVLWDCEAAVAREEASFSSARTQYDDQERAIQEADEAYAQARKAYEEVVTTIATLMNVGRTKRSLRDNHDKTLEDACDRINLKVEERLTAQRELDSLLEAGDIPTEQLTQQIEGLDAELARIKTAIEQRQHYAALDQELTKAIASAEEEEVFHEACKAIEAAIKTVRETLMADLVAPLIDRMNKFLAIAAPGREAYCRLANQKGKAVFELGWLCNDRRIPQPALSGGETVLFGAALAYALVMLANPPLKLLLLEVAELDHDNLDGLCRAIESINGELSNVLIACWTQHGYRDDWNYIDLSEDSVVA